MPMLVMMMAAVMTLAMAEESKVLVTLRQGPILGSREEVDGGVYYSFQTIPYAMPPVGPLRFQDPKPAPAWRGVRNGSLPFPKCPQSSIFFMKNYTVEGQEDCLYLNVYTPKPYKADLPVMVYIHGGALVIGSAMGPTPPMVPVSLVQNDVVVVSMNYRLGALGFLSTGDRVLPGNLGFKDQNLALRWVQSNIENLGGDPERVTIFGVSSGGFSCHLHVLSPSSTGLFHRAILQSGTALLPHSFPPAMEAALSISKALNCTGEDSLQLLACFMEASVEALVTVQNALSVWFDLPLTFGAQIDGTFLPDSPAALLKTGRYNKVDLMIGWTKDDGNLITTGLFSKAGEAQLRYLNENFDKVWAGVFMMEEDNPIYLARRMLFNYMSDFNVTIEDEIAFTTLIRDKAYEIPGVQSAELHAKNTHTKTFMYRLDHCLEKSLSSILTNTYIQRKMAGHGDDNVLLLQYPPLGPLSRPQDLYVQKIIGTLWTNFASIGNPTVNGTLGFRWTPVTPSQPLRYLSLTTSPTMQPVDKLVLDFWKSLPVKLNKQLYPRRFRQDYGARDML